MDNLYTLTLLLQDPSRRGRQFRASGIRKGFLYVAAEEARYMGKPEWDKWIADSRAKLDSILRATGFTEAEVMDKKQFPDWPTLGKYLGTPPLDDHSALVDGRSASRCRYGGWNPYPAPSSVRRILPNPAAFTGTNLGA
jgi:hypothetical protein